MEMKGIELKKAGWLVAAFEGFGILGMLSSGWMMDHILRAGEEGLLSFIC